MPGKPGQWAIPRQAKLSTPEEGTLGQGTAHPEPAHWGPGGAQEELTDKLGASLGTGKGSQGLMLSLLSRARLVLVSSCIWGGSTHQTCTHAPRGEHRLEARLRPFLNPASCGTQGPLVWQEAGCKVVTWEGEEGNKAEAQQHTWP